MDVQLPPRPQQTPPVERATISSLKMWQIVALAGLGFLIAVAVGFAAYALFGSLVSPNVDQPYVDEQPDDDEDDDPVVDEPARDGRAPLYMTTMTHMEGVFGDDTNKNLFNKHVSDIRATMELFDAYGAKLTIETERAFAEANTIWGVSILKEVVDGGHGVGSHADFGYDPRGEMQTLSDMTAELKELKATVDAVVGAENNWGTSGGIGEADWVKAAIAAGYKYKDGLTGIAYFSMPESARAPGWTDAFIRETGYHDSIPPEFSERIYPIFLKDATDLVEDADGQLAVMLGDLGELASLSEGRSNCFPQCTFDDDDIQAVVDAIKEADKIRDAGRVAHLNIHIPVKLFDEKNRATLEKFVKTLKTYADNGTIIWATQKEAYEGFVEWEGR